VNDLNAAHKRGEILRAPEKPASDPVAVAPDHQNDEYPEPYGARDCISLDAYQCGVPTFGRLPYPIMVNVLPAWTVATLSKPVINGSR